MREKVRGAKAVLAKFRGLTFARTAGSYRLIILGENYSRLIR